MQWGDKPRYRLFVCKETDEGLKTVSAEWCDQDLFYKMRRALNREEAAAEEAARKLERLLPRGVTVLEFHDPVVFTAEQLPRRSRLTHPEWYVKAMRGKYGEGWDSL